jgi:hypothetical protein
MNYLKLTHEEVGVIYDCMKFIKLKGKLQPSEIKTYIKIRKYWKSGGVEE